MGSQRGRIYKEKELMRLALEEGIQEQIDKTFFDTEYYSDFDYEYEQMYKEDIADGLFQDDYLYTSDYDWDERLHEEYLYDKYESWYESWYDYEDEDYYDEYDYYRDEYGLEIFPEPGNHVENLETKEVFIVVDNKTSMWVNILTGKIFYPPSFLHPNKFQIVL